MGRDKGLLPLAGKPLIEHVLAKVEGLGDELLLTTNNPTQYRYLGIRMAPDDVPGAGALDGLKTALMAARGERVLLIACDMPFLNRHLLEHIIGLDSPADLVVPRWKDTHQTMHAVYRRDTCLRAVRRALSRGDRRMISFYPEIQVRTIKSPVITRIDPQGLSFFNINTPEDLAEAERILAASEQDG